MKFQNICDFWGPYCIMFEIWPFRILKCVFLRQLNIVSIYLGLYNYEVCFTRGGRIMCKNIFRVIANHTPLFRHHIDFSPFGSQKRYLIDSFNRLQWRNRLARGTYTTVHVRNAEVVSSSLTWSSCFCFRKGKQNF